MPVAASAMVPGPAAVTPASPAGPADASSTAAAAAGRTANEVWAECGLSGLCINTRMGSRKTSQGCIIARKSSHGAMQVQGNVGIVYRYATACCFTDAW